jgi:hypothetical protein
VHNEDVQRIPVASMGRKIKPQSYGYTRPAISGLAKLNASKSGSKSSLQVLPRDVSTTA